MLIVKDAASTTSGSAPTRALLAQSTATRTRSAKSAGRVRDRPRFSRPRNRYSPGSGAGPPRNMTVSLPSARSASPAPRSEPSASPSGASWDVTTKRSLSRNAATTACMSVWVGIALFGRSELVDHPREPDAPLDRRIVFERQDRSSPRTELVRELRLQHAVRRLQPGERALLLLLAPEHADVDGRVREVLRRPHARDRHEADPRVLQARKAVRDHLADRLVDLPPALSARQGRPPPARFGGAPMPASRDSARPRRAASAARRAHASHRRRRAWSAARDRGGRPPPPRLRSARAAELSQTSRASACP